MSIAEPYLQALRNLAKELGVGPRELARRTGLPYTTVQHAIVGDRADMTLETAATISQALGASLTLRKGALTLATSGRPSRRRGRS